MRKRYLKEDGNVDIDYIDSLTNDEQMKVYRNMTFEELVFYIINGTDNGVRVWKDNESLDDMLKRGCVFADDFLSKLRREINQK